MESKISKNILITGGGTGGHLYPAIAIIEYLQAKYPDSSISFIGSRKGMSKKLIPQMNVDFYSIKGRGLTSSKSILKKILSYTSFIFTMIPGFIRAVY